MDDDQGPGTVPEEDRVLTIPTAESPPTMPIGDVQAVTVDSVGSVFILDRSAHAVLHFDSLGREVRRFGGPGPGGGPEDLSSPGALALGDTNLLWVRDSGNGRYVGIDLLNGERTIYRRVAAGGGPMTVRGLDTIYESVALAYSASEGVLRRAFQAAVPRDGRMDPLDTVPRPPPVEAVTGQVEPRRVGEGVAVGGGVPLPFTVERHDVVDPVMGYWTGTTDAFAFYHVGPDGDTLDVMSVPAPDVELSRSAREAAIQEMRSEFGDGLVVSIADLPTVAPKWSSFFIGDDRRIWVERFSLDEDITWEVYSPDGDLEQRLLLSIAGDPRPSANRRFMVGLSSTELAPTVIRYRHGDR